MEAANQDNGGHTNRACGWFKALWKNVVSSVVDFARDVKDLGQEDPRRIIHSMKVGFAIALVSLVYYFDPIYEGFGVSAMWAVITVVVVFEFSVGATLGRGVNRGIATLFGGALGVGAHRIASFSGIDILEPILLGLSVFLFAAAVTFMRFFPKLKARYDYGLLIFILTFCIISVSGYRDKEVLDMAGTRLSTILIGGSVSLAVCTLIFPVWAGEDLHYQVADNIEKLGNFLDGFGGAYFTKSEYKNIKDKKAPLEEYKSVLNAKGVEDSLVNFAKWEPRHGRFRYRHPWSQYQKIGALTRECAYRLDSLNGYLKSDEMQAPEEIRTIFEESCTKMSSECSHALKELSVAIKTMTRPSSSKSHIANAKTAADNLKELLKTNPWQDGDLLEIIPVATVASLLIDIVCCTVKIDESVLKLASLCKFKPLGAAKNSQQTNNERVSRSPSIEGSHNLVITVE